VAGAYEYFWVLLGGWLGIVLLLNGLASLLTRFTGWSVPQRLFLWVAALSIIVAGERAYQHEHERAEGLARVRLGRHLSDAQKRYIAEAIRHAPARHVAVLTPTGLSEGLGSEVDFVAVFKSVGWDVEQGSRYFEHPVFGLLIRYQLGDEAGDALASAVANVVSPPLVDEDEALAGRLELIVGEKRGE
jgi:hypothetical protein